ncbi:MAG TPA: hypothetical protein VND64_24615 [Pirellulales bacterium]|nr:hypothetical protein [Pirellulales bacterium]
MNWLTAWQGVLRLAILSPNHRRVRGERQQSASAARQTCFRRLFERVCQSVHAYNYETFGPHSTSGRESLQEAVLLRELRAALA